MFIFAVEKIVIMLHTSELEIRLAQVVPAMHDYLLKRQDQGEHFWSFEYVIKIFDVLDLAGLSHTVPLLLKSLLFVVFHSSLSVLKVPREEHEAADKSARSALPMVAVHHAYILDIFD